MKRTCDDGGGPGSTAEGADTDAFESPLIDIALAVILTSDFLQIAIVRCENRRGVDEPSDDIGPVLSSI